MHSRLFRSAVIAASVALIQSNSPNCKFDREKRHINCADQETLSFSVISDWGKRPFDESRVNQFIDRARSVHSSFVVSCGDIFYGKGNGKEQSSDTVNKNDGKRGNDNHSNQTKEKKVDIPWLVAMGDHGAHDHGVENQKHVPHKENMYMPSDQFHVPVFHKNKAVLHILIINTSDKINYRKKIDEAIRMINLINKEDLEKAAKQEAFMKKDRMIKKSTKIAPENEALKNEAPTNKVPIIVFGHDPWITSDKKNESNRMEAWYNALNGYPNVRLYVAGHPHGLGPVVPLKKKDIPMFLSGGGGDSGAKSAHGSASDSDEFMPPKNFEDALKNNYTHMTMTYEFRSKKLTSSFYSFTNEEFFGFQRMVLDLESENRSTNLLKANDSKKVEKK